MTKTENAEHEKFITSLIDQVDITDQIRQYYSAPTTIYKNDRGNVRNDVEFMLDRVSLDFFNRFSRARGSVLPPDFLQGVYALGSYQAMFTTYSNMTSFLRDRLPDMYVDYSVNRSFIRRFDLVGPVQRIRGLISTYPMILYKFLTVFNDTWVNPFINSIQFSVSFINPVTDFYKNSYSGVSSTVNSAKQRFGDAYSQTAAQTFIVNVLKYLADPFATLEFPISDSDTIHIAINFELVLFMYFFKPQCCTRNHATKLVTCLISWLSALTAIQTSPYQDLPGAIQFVAPYIPFALLNLITIWFTYATSVTDYQADYGILYDVFTDLSGNPSPGFQFWGDPALNPFRLDFTNANYFNVMNGLLQLFDANGFRTAKDMADAANICYEVVRIISTATSLSRTLDTLYVSIRSVCITPGYINRFQVNYRTKIVEFAPTSIFSFLVGGKAGQEKTFMYDFSNWLVYLNYEDYGISRLSMMIDLIDKHDKNICVVQGLTNNNVVNIFKDYEILRIAAEKCEKCILVDLINECKDLSDIYGIAIDRAGIQDIGFNNMLVNLYAVDRDINSNSRWLTETKLSDYFMNQGNWVNHGLLDGFIVSPAEYTVHQDGFIRKHGGNYISEVDYKTLRLNFGRNTVTRIFRDNLRLGPLKVKIPTFSIVKVVNKFSDSSVFKSSNSNNILEWFKTMKDPISITEPEFEYAVVEDELISVYYPTLDRRLPLWEDYCVTTVNYNFTTPNINDLDEILFTPKDRINVFLDELVDKSGELFTYFKLPSASVIVTQLFQKF